MSVKSISRTASWLLYVLLSLGWSNGSTPSNNDITLGGIFSEHYARDLSSENIAKSKGNTPCGDPNRRATADRLAMEFAVSEINTSNDILPEIALGVNMKDSCSDLDYAINNTLDYRFVKMKFINKSYQCAAEETETKCCHEHGSNGKNASVPLVAIIAGGYSHIVKAIVNLVGLFKVPVIGYSSTSPSLNKIDYFLRTVAPDTVSTQVMIDLIHELRWNIVSVLYVDNEFGHYAADCFRTAIRRMPKAKICIAYDEKFSTVSEQEEINKVIDGIEKARDSMKSRVIVFFGANEDFVYFHGHNRSSFDPNEYIWVASELWLTSNLIEMPKKIHHILTIIPEQGYPHDRFSNYLRRRVEDNTTCSDVNHVQSKYIPHVLDAVYAVAMALHDMLGCEAGKSCRNKLKTIDQRFLLDYLKHLNFYNNLTKQNISFDFNGNPRTVHYTAVKLEIGNGTYNKTDIGNWTCNTTTCTGRLLPDIIQVVNPHSFESNCGPTCYRGEHKSVKEEYPDCCWECRKCTGNKYTNTTGQFSCSECPASRWPDSNHTSCKEIEHDYLDVVRAPGALILVWSCVGIAIVLFVAGVFIRYSSSHIVRASSRQLSLLLLLGITMDFSLLITLLVEPNSLQCTVLFVLLHVTNCLITGTLFLKTNRIHRIFRKSAMTERPRCLGNACQFFIIVILVVIEVILAATVLVFKPENCDVRVTYIMQGENKKAFLLCNFFGKSFQNDLFHVLIWSYDCGMIFICTYQAYLVRKVPENYNEARYITFTMVIVSMNIVVYVITTSGMNGKNLVLVYCIFQSLRASVALGCMFLPKVYVILFQPENNVPHNPVKSKMGTFVKDNSVSVKPEDSSGSGSSIQASNSSGGSTSMTTSTTTNRGRPYRKVGAKVEQSAEEKSGDNFENAGEFQDLRAGKLDITGNMTEVCLRKSANAVLVNGLASACSNT